MDIEEELYNNYFTRLGEIDRVEIVAILNDQSALYCITKTDFFKELSKNATFTFNDWYSSNIFQGIMPDSRATEVLTAGEP